MALNTPCKASRSWQSLPPCPPFHRSLIYSNYSVNTYEQGCTISVCMLTKTTKGASAYLLEKHKSTHTLYCTRLLTTLLVHRATGRLCSIPLKVLWAVISKTIPWMAALIENNEGHIEHMVAVVSPFPPSSLLLSLSLSLFLSPDKRFRQTLPQQSKDL